MCTPRPTPHPTPHPPPQGYLKPLNQSAYWLGLQASSASWPAFSPLDPTAAPAGGAGGSYQLWGLSAPSGKPEPKSRLELCAAANATITGYPNEDPWSWSSALCTRQLPFLCRQQPPGQWSFQALGGGAGGGMGAMAAGPAGAGAAAGAGAVTYVLNTSRVAFDTAQAWCNTLGGRLLVAPCLAAPAVRGGRSAAKLRCTAACTAARVSIKAAG
jgi:hypothetical protein